ncbi:hypothetical protein AB0I27_25760 [Streptomyces sp. NPDC050597]|jgi:hypothetical protein
MQHAGRRVTHMQIGYRMWAVPVEGSALEGPQAENDEGEWRNTRCVVLTASGGQEPGKAVHLAERHATRFR